MGVFVTTASSDVATSASLGASAVTSGTRSGSLSIEAYGQDTNAASSKAGSGTVVGIDAADATTEDQSTVTASLGGGTTTAPDAIYADDVTVSATNVSDYAPSANSVNAAVVGGSGAVATNSDTTSATTTIGDYTTIIATGLVQISAKNLFDETTSGSSANAGAGGVVNGSAAKSTSTITGGASVSLGDGIHITSGTNPFADTTTNPVGILVLATSTLTADDLVTLTTGGLIEGSGVTSTINGTLNNTVAFGTNDQFTSAGNIGVGTYTTVSAQTNAEANTYGLAASSAAKATTSVTSNQTVTVGDGTTMTAFGNVNVTAGNDPTGQNSTLISCTANAQSYSEDLIGVATANPTTTVSSNTTLTMGTSTGDGGKIYSGRNVTIGAFPGSPGAVQVSGAHYSILFIPAANNSNSSFGTETTSADVTLYGTIDAGIYNTLTVTIPTNGAAATITYTELPTGVSALAAPTPNDSSGMFIPQDYVTQYFSPSIAPALAPLSPTSRSRSISWAPRPRLPEPPLATSRCTPLAALSRSTPTRSRVAAKSRPPEGRPSR